MNEKTAARKVLMGIGGAIGVLLFALVGLSACDSGDPSEEEATEDFCESLDELNAALGQYAALDVNSTIDDVDEAQASVTEAYEDVQSAAQDLAEARVDDLEAAYDALADEASDISGDDTIGEAYSALASQAQQVEAARADLASSANCS
jgi:hypothetical protein